MPRKSIWPVGTEIQKTTLGLPRKLWERARIAAMHEKRNLDELAAEALEAYLRRRKGERNG